MAPTDTFIVRVYRRGPGRDEMRGVVEAVGRPGEAPFAGAAELWQWLLVPVAERPVSPHDPSKGTSR